MAIHTLTLCCARCDACNTTHADMMHLEAVRSGAWAARKQAIGDVQQLLHALVDAQLLAALHNPLIFPGKQGRTKATQLMICDVCDLSMQSRQC